MKKIDRINKLMAEGCNVPKYEVIKNTTVLSEIIKILGKETEFSIRTSQEKQISLDEKKQIIAETWKIDTQPELGPEGLPLFPLHYHKIDKKDVKKAILLMLKYWDSILICPVIDAFHAVFAGAARITPKGIVLELALNKGSGVMVREVVQNLNIDYTYNEKDEIDMPGPKAIMEELKKLKRTNVVIELSYYNIPVGIKPNEVIFWDMTDDGTGKSGLDKKEWV